jgi:hypothetical protein
MSASGAVDRLTRLERLLLDPKFPYGFFLGGGDAEPAVVVVSDALEFARRRLGDVSEAELDALVRQLGGGRESMIDPWSWPRRTWKRLRGVPEAPPEVWTIPRAFFNERGVPVPGARRPRS